MFDKDEIIKYNRKKKLKNSLEHLEDNTLDYEECEILSNYIKKLNFVIIKSNELLEQILVIKEGNDFRPVKNTTKQEVYKTIYELTELLKCENLGGYDE